MSLRYGYVESRKREHRVAIDSNGFVRDGPQCNLDQTTKGKYTDQPQGRKPRCLHCHMDEVEVVYHVEVVQ